MAPPAEQLRHVILSLQTNMTYGRGVYRGVLRYAVGHRPWRLTKIIPAARDVHALVREQAVAGFIAHVASPDFADALASSGVPAVNISGLLADSPLPRVLPDNAEVGRIVARTLLNQGYKRLGFAGHSAHAYAANRLAGFAEVADAAGVEASFLNLNGLSWDDVGAAAGRWLETFGAPVGVMGSNDGVAVRLLDACRAAALAVPERVAVVGVDNDDVTAEMAAPPLSSVELGTDRIGFEAARLLDRLMQGHHPPLGPVLVAPIGLVPRQSSGGLAIADPFIASAVRYIHDHAHEGLQVKQVAAHLDVSRRWLEVRFGRATGRSPAQEIRRVRVERAKRVLIETDREMPDVADGCGFSDAKQFGKTFRRETGLTPSAYRRRFRLR